MGYTTWPSVTAGLEIGAEKKITSHLIQMLENVSGKPGKKYAEPMGKYANAINVLKPSRFGSDLEPGNDFESGLFAICLELREEGFQNCIRVDLQILQGEELIQNLNR